MADNTEPITYHFSSRLSKADIRRLADLYCQSLPGDILPMLGVAYVRCFYSAIARFKSEQVLVARDTENEIQAACIISFFPQTLWRRAILRTSLTFLFYFIQRILVSKEFRGLLLAVCQSRSDFSKHAHSPEIAFVFTAPQSRGKNIGSRMLEFSRRHLMDGGYNELYVRTLNTKENRAIDFYNKNDFRGIGTMYFAGREYLVLKSTFQK